MTTREEFCQKFVTTFDEDPLRVSHFTDFLEENNLFYDSLIHLGTPHIVILLSNQWHFIPIEKDEFSNDFIDYETINSYLEGTIVSKNDLQSSYEASLRNTSILSNLMDPSYKEQTISRQKLTSIFSTD